MLRTLLDTIIIKNIILENWKATKSWFYLNMLLYVVLSDWLVCATYINVKCECKICGT